MRNLILTSYFDQLYVLSICMQFKKNKISFELVKFMLFGKHPVFYFYNSTKTSISLSHNWKSTKQWGI